MEYKTRKFEFYVNSGYVGADRTEVVEIDIPVDATESEVAEIVNGEYEEWLWNIVDTGWIEV